MQKLSLQALAREQQTVAATASSGRSARTVFGGHEHVLRQTVIALTAGSSLSEHDNLGDATILVLSGRVRLTAGQVNWEGRQGDLLLIPSSRNSLLALEDAAILLSAAAKPAKAGSSQEQRSREPEPAASTGTA
ncbi:quercetin dioxygenase-like cupin family protein [Nakamurella sp. UYEF19]